MQVVGIGRIRVKWSDSTAKEEITQDVDKEGWPKRQ